MGFLVNLCVLQLLLLCKIKVQSVALTTTRTTTPTTTTVPRTTTTRTTTPTTTTVPRTTTTRTTTPTTTTVPRTTTTRTTTPTTTTVPRTTTTRTTTPTTTTVPRTTTTRTTTPTTTTVPRTTTTRTTTPTTTTVPRTTTTRTTTPTTTTVPRTTTTRTTTPTTTTVPRTTTTRTTTPTTTTVPRTTTTRTTSPTTTTVPHATTTRRTTPTTTTVPRTTTTRTTTPTTTAVPRTTTTRTNTPMTTTVPHTTTTRTTTPTTTTVPRTTTTRTTTPTTTTVSDTTTTRTTPQTTITPTTPPTTTTESDTTTTPTTLPITTTESDTSTTPTTPLTTTTELGTTTTPTTTPTTTTESDTTTTPTTPPTTTTESDTTTTPTTPLTTTTESDTTTTPTTPPTTTTESDTTTTPTTPLTTTTESDTTTTPTTPPTTTTESDTTTTPTTLPITTTELGTTTTPTTTPTTTTESDTTTTPTTPPTTTTESDTTTTPTTPLTTTTESDTTTTPTTPLTTTTESDTTTTPTTPPTTTTESDTTTTPTTPLTTTTESDTTTTPTTPPTTTTESDTTTTPTTLPITTTELGTTTTPTTTPTTTTESDTTTTPTTPPTTTTESDTTTTPTTPLTTTTESDTTTTPTTPPTTTTESDMSTTPTTPLTTTTELGTTTLPTTTPTTTTESDTTTTPTTTPTTTTESDTTTTPTTPPMTTTESDMTTIPTTTSTTTTESDTTTTSTTTPMTTTEPTTPTDNWEAFYPFGVANGDTVIPRTDDGSSSVIPLQQTFVYFGTAYHQIYVNNNGDLTFDSAWSSFFPYNFPAYGNIDIIAPFWTDLDTRGHGVVSYRQVTGGSVLQQATNDINQYFPQLSFTATWVFIATWDRVAYFSMTNTETSFQAVLISDGYKSFVLFNYGAIAPRGPVQAGYDTINSIHYFSIPRSYDSTNLPFSSNVNVQGRWAFRTDRGARGCQFNDTTLQVGYSFWTDRTCQQRCTCTRSGLQCGYDPCTFSQACRPDTFRYSCQPVQRTTCTIAGDPHYYTFDGRVFHFQGTCTYVLSQACNTTLPYYRVEGKNEHRGSTYVAWTRMVRVIVYDEEIEMVKDYPSYALVNGTFVAAPFSLRNGSIQVYQSGFSLAISTDFGLLVTYDAYHYVTVNVPYDYYNSTCGLCGVFNFNPEDDFLSSSGQILSSDLEFANSWQVSTDPDPQCQRTPCAGLDCFVCSSDQRTLFHSASQCGILQDPNGPFAPCQQRLPPQTYADSCVYDLCVGGGYQPVLCQALSAYSTQCQQLGIQPGPWRRQGFCEISCPANSHFESNGTGCPASCSNPTSPSSCIIPPGESCVCNQGYVLSAGTCVPFGQCGCTFEGRYYRSGDTVLLDENCGRQCSCNLGTMTCTAHSCGPMETCGVQDGVRGCQPLSYSTCWVEGHQLYRTFDGLSFQYPGACRLVLSKVTGWSQQLQFMVTAQMVPSGPQGTDFTRILTFEADNTSVSIEIGPISSVKVNGEAASLPFSTQSGQISVYHSSVTSIRLKTDFGVTLQVDWPYLVRITVPSSYNATLGGLCGNFNGNPADDFETPNGTLATSAQAFGDSWRNGSLSSLCTDTLHDTPPGGNDTNQYQNSCSIMSLSGGPFDQCRLVENPTQRIADCVQALSMTNGDHGVLCEALRNYALLCQQNGITVGDWRNYSNCEPSCPSNSHYEICGTSCPATCPSLSFPFLCSQPCQEGCQCNDGYLLSDSQCVRTTNCGCRYGGQYYQGGQSFWGGDGCSSYCTCDGTTGMVSCTPSSCSSLESCGIVDGQYGCHPLPQGVCLASGDPHYSTFDGYRFDFQGTCHYVLASLCNLTDGIEAFEVAARNQPIAGRPVSFTAEVFINVYGYQVDISSGYGRQGEIISGQHSGVQVDGVTTNLPLSLNNSQLVIYQNGFQTFVEADFGLTVRYDGWSTVSISLPSRYRGRTCGICGNFNGNADDDFVTRSGELVASASDFGSSWRVPGNYTCDDGCGDSCSACPDQTVAQSMCEVLQSNDGPMAFCHDHVDPEPYYTNCVFDVCLSGNRHDIQCQAIQTYISACQAASARVNPWREQTQCLIECPANSHYEVCGTDCNSTCASSLNSTCEQTCREGCFCDEGHFRSGASCVSAEHCGCQFDGFYFTAGDKFWTSGCSEHCECTESGQLRCAPAQCTATEECGVREGRLGCFDRLSTCTVTGDPHYFTFDGAIVHFQGTCSYEVARTCGNGTSEDLNFRVVATNQHRGNTRVAFVSSVDVWLRQGGQENHIFMGQSRNVKVDGTQVPLPSNIMSTVEILRDRNFVVLNVSSDLTLHFDGQSTLFIRLGESYRGSVCGMCGNFNGDPTDDKALPNGTVVLTDDEFGAGWKSDTSTPGCGASDVTGGGNNCTMMQDYSELCGIITMSSGPFSNCHPHIDPTPYFTSCVLDLCLYSSANHMLCSAVAAYEAVCSAIGFQIPEWRSDVHCPLTDPCDELECTDDEWCGERNGVYGCLCSEEHANTNAERFDAEETCNGSSATISLSRCQLFQSGFPSNSLHLNDRNCTGTVRNGRVEFHFDNDDHICGTALTSNGTHFIYQNTIHGETFPQGAIIRREKILSVPFNCAYLLSQSLSMSNSIRPLESILTKRLPTGIGRYRMRMVPYLDAQFQQPFTGSGMEMPLNQQVYVAVEAEGVDGRQMSTVLDSCWATPINDPLCNERWDLIVQECPNPADGTVRILQNGVSTSSRFSFRMFTFTSNSTTVFLHCQIHLCVLSGNNCSTSCFPGNQQKIRRSVTFQDTSSMSIGPFVLPQTDMRILERISVAGAPAS